jgi:hypothetical protein
VQLIFCYSFQETKHVIVESDGEGHTLSEITGNLGMSGEIVYVKIVHLIILQIPSFVYSTGCAVPETCQLNKL